MQRLEVSKTLRDEAHDEKAMNSQGDELKVHVCEDSHWLDEVSENHCQDSRWIEEVSKNLLEDQQCADEVSGKMNTQRDQDIKILPGELVERILAMVPFPFVFQARVLSKSWLARLSSISSQEDEDSKHLALSFQKRISEQSVSWKTFCPVLQRPCTASPISEISLHAFSRTTLTWLRLPSLSFLPTKVWERICRFDWSAQVEQIEGALVLLSMKSFPANARHKQLYVANILTRSWKELPPRPHGDTSGKTYLCHLVEKYKLIHMPDTDPNLLEMYDSISATWTSMKVITSLPRTEFYTAINEHTIASLDGVLYFCSIYDQHNPRTVPSLKVLAINLNGETSAEQFDVVAEVIDMRWREAIDVHTVPSNVNLLIVMVQMYGGAMEVVKIDLQSRQCLGVFLGPQERSVERMMWVPFASDGDCIFTFVQFNGEQKSLFGKVNDGVDCILEYRVLDRVLAYNVPKDWWDLFPYRTRTEQIIGSMDERRIGSAFRPGLNPFVAV